MTPYYADATVTLYHADCLTIPTLWTVADVLVTDPPYGRSWSQGQTRSSGDRHDGIVGDKDTNVRDAALAVWGRRPGVVFGDPLIAIPQHTRQALVYRKPPDAGSKGTFGGFRRDIEMVYLVGDWPAGLNGDSSVLTTGARVVGNPSGLAARYGHPHAKPVDVMCNLVSRCPVGVVVDPFCGSGSTLVAARLVGRRAVGVEIEERYCAMAAARLRQLLLPIG